MDIDINPNEIGGIETNLNKIEISDDALGVGKAISGVAKEIRKGGEGLLDKADRVYSLKHTLFPVLSAKREAKALDIQVEAIESASRKLLSTNSSIPEELKYPVQMMIADYAHRYININSTLQKALPMISADADTSRIDDDWLSSAFDYIGGVSKEELQELWARLLAQEANCPGMVSKRAFVKLSMFDHANTVALKNIFDFVISLYHPFNWTCSGSDQIGFFKIGRFSLPLFHYLTSWSGPKADDDLEAFQESERHHMRPGFHDYSWLLEEHFIEQITPTFFMNSILHEDMFSAHQVKYDDMVGIRLNYSPMYFCRHRTLKDYVRKLSRGGVCSHIFQLTDLSESVLDPMIFSKVDLTKYDHTDEENFENIASKLFGLKELELEVGVMYDNPGFLPKEIPPELRDVKFYYR